MIRENYDMQKGWDFAAHLAGVNFAADAGHAYVSEVAKAILEMEENINNHQYRNLGVPQFQGYVAEEWSAGTFNIDAIAAGSTDRANVLHSTELGSVDVRLDSGAEYSLKSYADGAKSAVQQARINPETGDALYNSQHRWVPNDQLADAQAKAHRESLRNILTRPEVADANAETEAMLTSVVQNEEGIESIPVDRKDLDRMAKLAKGQEFSAENEGVTLASVIKSEYMLQQALKAGYTAAAITAVMQLTPEIFKAVDYLVKHGEIDLNQIKKMGTKAVSASAEGFLRGSISCSLLIMCEKGVFGAAMKSISPTLVGTIVAITLETVKNSILVAAGKMSAKEMGAAFVDGVVVSIGFVAGMKIGGAIGQALGFQLPVVGYLLGSLVGCVFAAVYNVGKKSLISFCVDTGFTCFGLVDQSYELPEETLRDMGVEFAPITRAEVSRADIQRASTTNNIGRAEYETVDIKILKRGVIGVNKIGYVIA